MAPNDDTVATLSDSLRRVSEQLMAAKQGRTACANLVTEGSALLMEMRRQEEHIWGQVAQPVMEAAAAKRSMEDAEAELHGLRYHKQQCVRGLAECNELAPQLVTQTCESLSGELVRACRGTNSSDLGTRTTQSWSWHELVRPCDADALHRVRKQ